MSWALATVNINTAGEEQNSKALPGIGPGEGRGDCEYRKRRGNFKSVEELKECEGHWRRYLQPPEG